MARLSPETINGIGFLQETVEMLEDGGVGAHVHVGKDGKIILMMEFITSSQREKLLKRLQAEWCIEVTDN